MWNSTEVIIWDLSAVHRPVLKHTHTHARTHTHTHTHTHARSIHASSSHCLSSLCFSTAFIRSSAHAHIALSEIFCAVIAPVARTRRVSPLVVWGEDASAGRVVAVLGLAGGAAFLVAERGARGHLCSCCWWWWWCGAAESAGDWVTCVVTRCWSGQGRGRAHASSLFKSVQVAVKTFNLI